MLSGFMLDKTEIVELLEIDSFLDECIYLRKKANEASHILTGDKAYTWGAIGPDSSVYEMELSINHRFTRLAI